MNDKTLKWVLYILGAFCFFIWISLRIEPLFNLMLKEKIVPEYWENTRWGELYYFNFIKDFQEKNLPPCTTKYRYSEKHPPLEQADIILFGDSFFDFTRMTTFPEQLSDSLNKKVHYVRYDKPMEYLDQHNYSNRTPKLMIYETAERFFYTRFANEQPDSYAHDKRNLLRKAFDATVGFLFVHNSEMVLDQLLCRSYLTNDIHSSINTMKFKWFGYITDQTPVYSNKSKDVPWLFVSTEVSKDPSGFYYRHTKEEIEKYCDHIESLSDKLKERYNLQMAFMIIPSKFTIYCNIVDSLRSSYGNLIPELYRELDERGIPVIKIYDDYLSERDNKLLYFGTDTHWTEDGLQIALKSTIRKIDSIYPRNYNAQLNSAMESPNLDNVR